MLRFMLDWHTVFTVSIRFVYGGHYKTPRDMGAC